MVGGGTLGPMWARGGDMVGHGVPCVVSSAAVWLHGVGGGIAAGRGGGVMVSGGPWWVVVWLTRLVHECLRRGTAWWWFWAVAGS